MTRILRSILSFLPNVVLIGSGVLLGAVLFARAPTRQDAEFKRYRQGDTAPVVAGYNYRDAPVTVVLFLSTHCRFCQESIPFYQRMTALPEVAKGRARVIGVFDEAPAAAAAYLRQAGLQSVLTGRVDPSGWVGATPALLVVRDTGRVEVSTVGRLTPRSEDSVVGLVTALAH